MNVAKNQFEKSVGEVKTPFSYLFVGGDEIKRNEVREFFVKQMGVIWDDIDEFGRKSEYGEGKSIDEAREFIRKINLTPKGKKRLALIYDVDKMNQYAVSALLKTIEEPPKGATIVIFSETENILSTVLSRCEIHRLFDGEEKALGYEMTRILESDFCKQVKEIEEIGRAHV